MNGSADLDRPPGRGRALTTAGLAGAMTRLARECAGPGVTVDGILRGLCTLAEHELAVDGVGVMSADGPGLRFVHGVPGSVQAVETLQESLQRGPCIDSLATRAAVMIDDLSGCHQWPELVSGSVAAGIGSVLSLPLQSEDRVWGVLDLYRSTPSAWSRDDVVTAQALADVAASYVALVTERGHARVLQDELEHRAGHDELTGLPSRALLLDRLDQAIRAGVRHRAAIAVLFVDVDGFKHINDVVGHAFGDRVLVEVAQRLQQTLRANDTLARLSGDEFVIICEDLTGSPAQIRRRLHLLGRRIQLAMRRPPRIGEVEIVVAVSIGVVVSTRLQRPQDLIHGADRAMYQAKQRGGAQLVISQAAIVAADPEARRPPADPEARRPPADPEARRPPADQVAP